MAIMNLSLKILFLCVAVFANSNPEQLQMAKKEQLASAAKLTPMSRPTRTIADQPTIMLNDIMQAQEAQLALPPPPGRLGPVGGPYPGRGFKQNPNIMSIGAVLDTPEGIAQFLHVVEEVSLEPNIGAPGVTMYAVSIPLNQNAVRTAQSVCEKLIKSQVYAIIISDGSFHESSSALAVTQTASFYSIPVIGLQNRDSSMSDKHVHSTYMRTVPPYSHQVDVWIEMLKELDYRHVIFIHSADYDGRTSFTRFEALAEKENIQIKSVIEYEPGLTEIAEELEEADEEMQTRVYLLYANELDSQNIFIEASRLNMTSPGYVWIVSEQSLRTTNVPDGVLALKLFNATNGAGHLRDAVQIVGQAIRDMYYNENITRPPSNCGDLGMGRWDTGAKFFNYLRKQSIGYGRTGRVAFDGKGDRIDADYEIINVVHGRPVMVGQYAFAQAKMKMQLWLNSNNIIWPGYQTIKPLGYVIPTHLKVVTISEEPFIFTREPRHDGSCDYDQIPCPKFDTQARRERMFCCEGYCVDFLRNLSVRLNFSYSLYQVIDDTYGDFEHVNGSEYPKMWTGLVGDLVYKRADMIVAPLTINPERSLVIEFSKPFKYQGISILERIQPRKTTFRFFNEPLANSLWLLVGVTVHVVALALYLLDRFSPFGRYKLPNSDVTEEDALNLSSAIWFAWGVLLNSGIGEGTPRSFAGRVLGMVWAGFAMIMVASYTANLAAFLVLDRPESSITGINDPRLRNPVDDFTFASVKGSAVEMYFKRQVELSLMYRRMQEKSYNTAEEAIAAVRDSELDAFIWDSSRLEYEASKDCDMATATEQFGRSGYGIGLQKASFWTEKINRAILAMHESGFMEELDNKWILQGEDDQCPNRSERQKPATLGLRNMAGVFLLVGIGIVGGIGLIVIEVIYKRSQVKQQKQQDAARNAAEKWKRLVERRKMYRESMQQLRQAQIQQSQQLNRRPPRKGDGTMSRQQSQQSDQTQGQHQGHGQQQQDGGQYGHTQQQQNETQQRSQTPGGRSQHGDYGQQQLSQAQAIQYAQLQQQQQVLQTQQQAALEAAQRQQAEGQKQQALHNQQIYAAQLQAQAAYQQQVSAVKQHQAHAQQAYYQQQLSQQGKKKHHRSSHHVQQGHPGTLNEQGHYRCAAHSQSIPAISPPEQFANDPVGCPAETENKYKDYYGKGYQSDSYGVIVAKPAKLAKAEEHAKRHKAHRKSSKSDGRKVEPVPVNDDSYELCMASDAELHLHSQPQTYYTMPHQHPHPLRSSQNNGRSTQTLMRPPHAIYRRPEEYGYHYNNTA